MKKVYIAIATAIATMNINAQTVSTFENITLEAETFRDGQDSTDFEAKGFASGNAFFTNLYNNSSSWGYWESGFAISNRTDAETDTAGGNNGFSKMYVAITGKGNNNSANYALGQQNAVIRLTGNAQGKQVEGVYITNSNYAYLSMKFGDDFAKQFTDSDYFVVSATGFKNGQETDTTVSLYLADGTNILTTWQWVDLKPLGDVDSIQFTLTSSDTGEYGINTPLFFAIDDFTTRDIYTSISEVAKQEISVSVYPNPTSSIVNINAGENKIKNVTVFDITGKILLQSNQAAINISTFNNGLYLLQVVTEQGTTTAKILKN